MELNSSGTESDSSGTESAKIFNGQLMKYTNVMKGWQNRYFTLDATNRRILYYLPEDLKKPPENDELSIPDTPPRCVVNLEGSAVYPSADDSVSFNIIPVNGECLRLKATDANERKLWIERIRRAAEATFAGCSMLTTAGFENDQSEALTKSLTYSDACHQSLINSIQSLPTEGIFGQLDKDILSVKASSVMSLMILHDCFRYVRCQRKIVFPFV